MDDNANKQKRRKGKSFLRVIQINLGKSDKSVGLLEAYAEKISADIALVQEPPFAGGKVYGFSEEEGVKVYYHQISERFEDRPKAAIVIFVINLQI